MMKQVGRKGRNANKFLESHFTTKCFHLIKWCAVKNVSICPICKKILAIEFRVINYLYFKNPNLKRL